MYDFPSPEKSDIVPLIIVTSLDSKPVTLELKSTLIGILVKFVTKVSDDVIVAVTGAVLGSKRTTDDGGPHAPSFPRALRKIVCSPENSCT